MNIMLVFVEKGTTIKIINKNTQWAVNRGKLFVDGPIDINEYKFTCRGYWPGVVIVAQAQMVQ